jgi:hypothetical protein
MLGVGESGGGYILDVALTSLASRADDEDALPEHLA